METLPLMPARWLGGLESYSQNDGNGRIRYAMITARNFALVVFATALGLTGCGRDAAPVQQSNATAGVLLVAHGSTSSTWKQAIETLADAVREPILQIPGVQSVQLTYIDEPKSGIADAMRAFDKDGVREVIVVPLLIATESTVTNAQLQFLTGVRSEAKAIKQLQNDGYEIYYPRARVTITPALNSSEVLKKNVLRRVRELQGDDSGEDMSVLLVGYGDQVYGQQMEEIMQGIGRYLKIKTDIDTVAYAFCGNLVDYSGEPVVRAINELLEFEEEVLVVPVLLAVDEKLQVNTIQAAINAVATASKVRYRQDSVLPDPNVDEWVVDKVGEAMQRVNDAGGKTVPAPSRVCEPDC